MSPRFQKGSDRKTLNFLFTKKFQMSEINELFWIVEGMFPKLDIILRAQDYVRKIKNKEEIRLILRVSLRHLKHFKKTYSIFSVCVRWLWDTRNI